MEHDTPPSADCLGELLAEERAALLSGNFAALPGLVARKEELVAALAARTPEASPELERLRAAAEANMSLLAAARDAVSAVRVQLETLRNGGPSLQTYDAEGRATTHGGGTGTLERRA